MNDYIYCTAIIKSTNKLEFINLVEIFRNLEFLTNKEDGCVSFKVVPMSKENGTIALWEIWRDEESFYRHHKLEHTKEIAEQNLTEVIVFESSKKLSL